MGRQVLASHRPACDPGLLTGNSSQSKARPALPDRFDQWLGLIVCQDRHLASSSVLQLALQATYELLLRAVAIPPGLPGESHQRRGGRFTDRLCVAYHLGSESRRKPSAEPACPTRRSIPYDAS